MSRILIADDDINLRDYILLSLNENMIKNIDFATTAKDAIELIKKNHYQKAIIDLRFVGEDLSGFDILQVALEMGIPERIVFTSVSNPMNLFEKGATAAFRKPLNIKKIKEFIVSNNYELLKEGQLF